MSKSQMPAIGLPRTLVERLREIEQEHFDESIEFTKVYDKWVNELREGERQDYHKAPVGNPPYFFVWVCKAIEISSKRSWLGPVETVMTSTTYEWDIDMIRQMDGYTQQPGQQTMRQYLMGKDVLLPS